MLTPSFAANAPLERLVFIRYFVSNSARELVLFWQGFESTLTVLITRWQKGFRNHPFRHIRFLGFSRISGSNKGQRKRTNWFSERKISN
jgi:hypothetical protein